MKTEDDVRDLEKLIVQLQGVHIEISMLAKKAPNDGLNLFKLKLVNNILAKGNSILTGHYMPLENFTTFDESALPTNSDVTMVLPLYIEQAERFRSSNMVYRDYTWRYLVNGAASQIEGSPPTKIGRERK
ncbi:MAG: hypothetical protein IPO99_09355 [Nitrospira sp.]|nr:hypothetical protein [Nitrospira sp.]